MTVNLCVGRIQNALNLLAEFESTIMAPYSLSDKLQFIKD
jgi:hypothetical protein